MSSSDFEKVLIRDERLDCADSIPYAVYRSGANVTVATFDAISQSNSSIVFNIQVPSETTVIDRRIIWESDVEFDVTATTVADASGNQVIAYGLKQGLGAYPLHSLCSTQQVTINNNSVSWNCSDVLPVIQRLHDIRENGRYNGALCPICPDNLANYADGVNTNFNVLAGAQEMSMDPDFTPRGSYIVNVTWTAGTAISATGGGLAPGVVTYKVKAKLREPLLQSPFIFTRPYHNGQGFYGIQNMNFVFNLNAGQPSSNAQLWKVANVTGASGGSYFAAAPVISGLSITNSKLIFNFLTPKPSDMLAARNIVPYWDMPRFLRPGVQEFSTAQGNTHDIPSQSLQLNMIPDKLIVFYRKAVSTKTVYDSDRSLYFSKISINFNNMSGILASATPDQLWRYSVEAGSNQTWQEYSGLINLYSGPFAAVQNGSNVPTQVATVGSYLMLDFGRHIQLTEDYYAPGSLGNFNLQYNVVAVNTGADLAAGGDLVTCCVNTGLFVTEKGQSATYTGILLKKNVLEASNMTPHSDADARRMVGGGFSIAGLISAAKNIAGKAAKYMPLIKGAIGMAPEGKVGDALRKGVGIAEKVIPHVQNYGNGRPSGAGKGSASFNIQDRLV